MRQPQIKQEMEKTKIEQSNKKSRTKNLNSQYLKVQNACQ